MRDPSTVKIPYQPTEPKVLSWECGSHCYATKNDGPHLFITHCACETCKCPHPSRVEVTPTDRAAP